MKETPIAALHEELGGKMVPFAGWRMPVQYSSIINEHTAVRERVGIFDISHMGQFFLSGPGAAKWLNTVLANDVNKLGLGDAQYTFLLNPSGGVIDDLIIYRQGEDEIFLVVNASMIDEDFAALSALLPAELTLTNESADWAGMAIQGPESTAIHEKLFPQVELPTRNRIVIWEQDGEKLIICRTGYTGEDGYEFFCPAGSGSKWFKAIVDAGAEPCGLGARDSLRLEVCYPLNGSDLAADKTPLQAGLGFFCALDKGDFVGRDALVAQKENGLGERLVAIQYTGRGAPPRAHYPVCLAGGEPISELSSGVLSPSLKIGIGMAYLPVEHAKIGTQLEIDVRGRRFPAEVVKKPFYKKG
ncbi:glycine cleavage system aminomethyltransferase GcvT [Persicirhabdus sediminis]|nr:glycine cleavage system aminomethyltransferase GcvT [Persicirhabdus sediminis]